MGNRFAELAFSPAAKELQRAHGSARQYDRMQEYGPSNSVLGPSEAEFIGARDSFYIATVNENGWPYVQHRGGPKGFLRVLDEQRLAFPDFRGNSQYISVGNATVSDKAALFLMDYPNQTRLKILGHLSAEDQAKYPQVRLPGYRAIPERALVLRVEAFDWNCPQHITPRYTEEELALARFARGKRESESRGQ